MKICHIASEISPIAKVGGLADVTLGLSRETQKLGHEAFVVIPKYRSLKTSQIESYRPLSTKIKVYFANKWHICQVFTGKVCGVDVYFIDSEGVEKYFDRSKIYGYSDDPKRFAFFSAASTELIYSLHAHTDIIHIHDWQTALIAPILEQKYRSKLHASLVFTIHNLNYQGITHQNLLKKIGLDHSKSLQDPTFANKINLMKGGIYFSDFVTTVSPNYAEEIKYPEFGMGLDLEILKQSHKIEGILNGIDPEIWNPNLDQTLEKNYSVETLDYKALDKDHLRKILKMPLTQNTPLVICICRLVPQKGLRMIKKAIDTVLKLNGQFILFGSSPIAKIQNDFEILKDSLASNNNIRFIFDSYNEDLAHQIYAGGDLLICPSLFEPCGLTQLIALQYGTVPLVRKTGGLANTVFDIEKDKDHPMGANGFNFTSPTSKAIDQALRRAFKVFRKQPETWRRLIQHGMLMDFSWEKSARRYLEIYKLIQKEGSTSSKKAL